MTALTRRGSHRRAQYHGLDWREIKATGIVRLNACTQGDYGPLVGYKTCDRVTARAIQNGVGSFCLFICCVDVVFAKKLVFCCVSDSAVYIFFGVRAILLQSQIKQIRYLQVHFAVFHQSQSNSCFICIKICTSSSYRYVLPL